MKTIGMIGGMSWESSLDYYRIMNEKVRDELGRLHSAKTLMYSVDFEEIGILQHKQAWDELTAIMIDIARRLESSGAELMMICTNTMHKMADEVQNSINIPLLHIADAAADAIKQKPLTKVGLLGTRFTMEQDFYKGRLKNKHDIEVFVPDDADMNIVHAVIYDELCVGKIKIESRNKFLEIIDRLVRKGAEGIILGCTEIPLLIRQEDTQIPIFNTTELHAAAAVRAALT